MACDLTGIRVDPRPHVGCQPMPGDGCRGVIFFLPEMVSDNVKQRILWRDREGFDVHRHRQPRGV